jgi:hypothetical protein
VVPSLLAGEQRRQHGASQLGDDEPQALALNQALHDQPRSGPCAVAGGPGACRKAEQCNALRRVQFGRDRLRRVASLRAGRPTRYAHDASKAAPFCDLIGAV